MNERIKADLYIRAKDMYEVFQNLSKEYMPEKWYESKYEFEIVENKEINGKSWSKENIDHVEINSGVIDKYYNYFSKVMDYFRAGMLEKCFPGKGNDEYMEWSL